MLSKFSELYFIDVLFYLFIFVITSKLSSFYIELVGTKTLRNLVVQRYVIYEFINFRSCRQFYQSFNQLILKWHKKWILTRKIFYLISKFNGKSDKPSTNKQRHENFSARGKKIVAKLEIRQNRSFGTGKHRVYCLEQSEIWGDLDSCHLQPGQFMITHLWFEYTHQKVKISGENESPSSQNRQHKNQVSCRRQCCTQYNILHMYCVSSSKETRVWKR